MKSRLFVVNEETFKATVSKKEVSIYMPDLLGKEWVKTIADIMADLFQIEIGDYVFLWEIRNSTSKSKIYGVYRVISKPYFVASKNDKYPFKLKIEQAYIFENPIEEYDFINCPYIKNKQWTIIGKKVAGKSRGTTPLSIEEARDLITMLIGANPNYTFIPFNRRNIINISNPLDIDYANTLGNIGCSRFNINPNKLSFFDSKYNLRYEKMLETIFNHELTNRNEKFFKQLGIDCENVVWYSNYLPYSIEQSEMDYVIIESYDKLAPSKIYVLEFMIKHIDEDHISRIFLYSDWVRTTLALGQNIVKPILICKSSPDFSKVEKAPSKVEKFNLLQMKISILRKKFKMLDFSIYTYNFNGSETPTFIKKL